MSSHLPEEQIVEMYAALAREWGPQHWWPAQSRFEVIVGAYLTQNTNWTNVETAMKRLRAAKVLNVAGIRNISLGELENLVRSSGYFHQKAARLKRFASFLDGTYDGSINKMFAQPTMKLRHELLSLTGVGPETADSILLYAGQHAIFVVDTYTRRIAARHGILPEQGKYEDFRALFELALLNSAPRLKLNPSFADSVRGAAHPPSRMSRTTRSPMAQVFNEMHGYIVGIGKKYCFKARPHCDDCPLRHLLPAASP
jgi:endonuclease-3 related protein